MLNTLYHAMNYQRQYDLLITKGLSRIRPDGYVERHHILPKSLGGTNEKSNIVVLTAREHWVAHLLLCQIHKTTKHKYRMAKAVQRMMCKKVGMCRTTGRLYQFVRAGLSYPKSPEHRAAISKALKGKKQTSPKQVIAHQNRPPCSQQTKVKISLGNTGKPEQ